MLFLIKITFRSLHFMTELIRPSLTNCEYQKRYRWIFWENRCLQTPWVVVKLFAGLIYTTFIYLFLLKDPTDTDIIRYVENSVLALFIECHNNHYSLEVEQCKIQSCTPLAAIKSINMIFRKPKHGVPRIESFDFNGETITNRGLILEILFFYHTASLHPKFHLYANSLTKYIIDNSITTLQPSTKTSLPLHKALTTLPISPVTDIKTRTDRPWIHRFLTRVFSVDITRESMIRESVNPAVSEDIPRLLVEGDLPFIRYLAECREAVKQAVIMMNLPLGLLEPLFYQIVVHGVDHKSCYAHTWNLKFGVGEFLIEPSSWTALFRSLMFRWMMVKPTCNPLWPNTLKCITRNVFYEEIYKAVKLLDVKYKFDFADIITASIMY